MENLIEEMIDGKAKEMVSSGINFLKSDLERILNEAFGDHRSFIPVVPGMLSTDKSHINMDVLKGEIIGAISSRRIKIAKDFIFKKLTSDIPARIEQIELPETSTI